MKLAPFFGVLVHGQSTEDRLQVFREDTLFYELCQTQVVSFNYKLTVKREVLAVMYSDVVPYLEVLILKLPRTLDQTIW